MEQPSQAKPSQAANEKRITNNFRWKPAEPKVLRATQTYGEAVLGQGADKGGAEGPRVPGPRTLSRSCPALFVVIMANEKRKASARRCPFVHFAAAATAAPFWLLKFQWNYPHGIRLSFTRSSLPLPPVCAQQCRTYKFFRWNYLLMASANATRPPLHSHLWDFRAVSSPPMLSHRYPKNGGSWRFSVAAFLAFCLSSFRPPSMAAILEHCVLSVTTTSQIASPKKLCSNFVLERCEGAAWATATADNGRNSLRAKERTVNQRGIRQKQKSRSGDLAPSVSALDLVPSRADPFCGFISGQMIPTRSTGYLYSPCLCGLLCALKLKIPFWLLSAHCVLRLKDQHWANAQ